MANYRQTLSPDALEDLVCSVDSVCATDGLREIAFFIVESRGTFQSHETLCTWSGA